MLNYFIPQPAQYAPRRLQSNVDNYLRGVLLMLVLLSKAATAADIEVNVDRNPVNVNESLRIVFSATETPDDDPDFSPLQQDFEILNQGRSEKISMQNFTASKSINWELQVIPKRSGELIIPAISFGSDRSPQSRLMVNEGNQNDTNSTPEGDLFLRVKASPQDPLVQAQVLYTLRLYRKVNISQASLTEPESADAVIEKLGDDKNYKSYLNGENYFVTERIYAVFPQKSGAMTIDPVLLTAEVVTGRRSRFGGFFNSPSTITKRVRSEAVTLQVQAVPAEFTASHWLPAQQLLLDEKFSGDINQIKVGEPLTMTISLLAKGTTVSQLPELFNHRQGIYSDNQGELKTYPDQPVLQEQKNNLGVIALREEKIALIPSKAGSYRLPEISIPWWNTISQQMETAVIPARTITAITAAGNVTEVRDSTVDITAKQAAATTLPTQQSPLQYNSWFWIAMFFACGWISTVLYFLSKRKAIRRPVEPAGKAERTLSAIKRACRNNDADSAKNALITWGREKFRESSLGNIARHCDDALREQIQDLNLHLYKPDSEVWQGGDLLLRAFVQANKNNHTTKNEDTALQPLYK